MRSWSTWILAWVLLWALAACGEAGGAATPPPPSAAGTGPSQPADSAPVSGIVCRIGTQTTYALTPEETQAIAAILDQGSWNPAGTADCINDYQFTINRNTYFYHSECGTFQDDRNNRSLTATGTEKERINGILGADNP